MRTPKILSLNSGHLLLILTDCFQFPKEKQIYHRAFWSILYNARLAVIKFRGMQPEAFEKIHEDLPLMMLFDVYTIYPFLSQSEKCVPSAIVFMVCCKNKGYRCSVNMVQFDFLWIGVIVLNKNTANTTHWLDVWRLILLLTLVVSCETPLDKFFFTDCGSGSARSFAFATCTSHGGTLYSPINCFISIFLTKVLSFNRFTDWNLKWFC